MRKRNAILAVIFSVFMVGVIVGNIWSNTQKQEFERHETYSRTTSRR